MLQGFGVAMKMGGQYDCPMTIPRIEETPLTVIPALHPRCVPYGSTATKDDFDSIVAIHPTCEHSYIS